MSGNGLPDLADESDLVRHVSQNRDAAPSKLRRDGRHCPLCLVAFAKNARRTRRMRCCLACGAHPQAGKSCVKCGHETVWQGRGQAACARCGLHGSPQAVIASPPAADC